MGLQRRGLRGDQPLPQATGSPPPALAAAGEAWLATRPAEIDFTTEGGLRGRVRRRAYLGETLDYRIEVGGQELRAQKTRHDPGPGVGEACGLILRTVRWYSVGNEAAGVG